MAKSSVTDTPKRGTKNEHWRGPEKKSAVIPREAFYGV